MFKSTCAILVLLLLISIAAIADAAEVSSLRLTPFPKQIELQPGAFSLDAKLVLEAPAQSAKLLGQLTGEEMQRAGLPVPEIRAAEGSRNVLRLSAKPGGAAPEIAVRESPTADDYALVVAPDAITCTSPGAAGLYYAAQTLRQLIRANRQGNTLPCMTVRDWPSLRWRCYQDDLTRGPSSLPATLNQEIDLGSELKMNLFTYYMEYQFAFRKHPLIGPKDGSLEPDDLKALVTYAKERHVDVLGNQQSFGHFSDILSHEEYASLRETPGVLCPVKEESYKLLDDMYSEVCPLLPFPMFNVCCDETYGLGTGPSKELAEKIGTGGVYVQHLRRIHDLLKDKYGKRMMMWGDIILQHPDKLDQIPKDTVMLTWGYGARESFDDQIVPFAKSGYEFFVCPGISNWSRILPDFRTTTVNIRNFVRDGAKHGAIGMLNTEWEDDGEALQGYKWHGYAWGAECAWNASTTTPEDFNRRIGAVLFGEKGDHFGQAIELLAQAHALPGMDGMNNRRFWQNDFTPGRCASAVKTSGAKLLEVVRPAVEHLEACKKETTVNAPLLDRFLFGARRMERIGQRMLDGLEAIECYTEAYGAPREKAAKLLDRVEKLVRTNREAHAAFGREFEQLWLVEAKPYSLDRVMARYAALDKWYEDLQSRLAAARKDLEAGNPLPPPEQIGLAMPEQFTRRQRPHKIEPAPLGPETPWAEPASSHRLGLTVAAGSAARAELPVSVDVAVASELASKPIRAFCAIGSSTPQEIPAQLDPGQKSDKQRLTFVIPGPIPNSADAKVFVYLGLREPPKPLPQAVGASDGPNGMKWMENDKVHALLGPEGSHVYRWEIKARDGRDMTMPGEGGWAGWSDVAYTYRSTPFDLTCTARGPAMVEYVCREPSGLIKTVRLFAGASWMEVVLNEPVGHYWDFDDPKNFAADGPTPGTYLFSNGKTGPVGKQAEGVHAQVKMGGVRWAMKFNGEKLALGLATPEVASHFVLAPGAGAGGVGLEQSPAAGHFITYAGILEAEPAEAMNRLTETLRFDNQPKVVLYAVQPKP